MDQAFQPLVPAHSPAPPATPTPAVPSAAESRSTGFRRIVLTGAISALLLVGGGVAAVSAASPAPSTAPGTTAPWATPVARVRTTDRRRTARTWVVQAAQARAAPAAPRLRRPRRPSVRDPRRSPSAVGDPSRHATCRSPLPDLVIAGCASATAGATGDAGECRPPTSRGDRPDRDRGGPPGSGRTRRQPCMRPGWRTCRPSRSTLTAGCGPRPPATPTTAPTPSTWSRARARRRSRSSPAQHTPLGLVWSGDTLFVASAGRVDAYAGFAGGTFASHTTVLTLPSGVGEVNGLAMSPAGRLVLGVSAPCDACTPTTADAAAVLSFLPDGIRPPRRRERDPGAGRTRLLPGHRRPVRHDEPAR